jgi:hypothetical protein
VKSCCMFADGIVLPTQGGTLTFASSGEKMALAKPANTHIYVPSSHCSVGDLRIIDGMWTGLRLEMS